MSVSASSFEVRKSKYTYLSFDGVNDLVDLTNDATLWSQSLTKFSFAFWINPNVGYDGNVRRLFDHGAGTAQGINCFLDNAVSNKIIFEVRSAANVAFQASATTLNLDQVHHVVCVYDNSLGSANLKIYVDGVVGGTTANLTEAINQSITAIIAGSANRFGGRVIDFRWWTTKALSQSEVTSLFNGTGDTEALLPNYWLPLNDGTGNPLDIISGTKVGTLTNGTAWATQSSLGGDIDLSAGGLVNLNAKNNLWPLATGSETINGSNQYRTFYVKFLGPGTVKTFSMVLAQATKKTGYTNFQWAFDPLVKNHYYRYHPYKEFNGSSDFISIADAAPLDLVQFSVACWFRTTADYSVNDGLLVNKGGVGSDTSGQNMNYGIWFDSTIGNTIKAGFEETAGTDHFVNSPKTYNDGKWHHGVVTYDQVTVRLYIDGFQVASVAATQTPESNAQPLVIGRNSRASSNFFTGDIDEIYVWNNDLTAAEVRALYWLGTVPQTGALVYEEHFGLNDSQIDKQASIMKRGLLGPFGTPVWLSESQIIPDPPNVSDLVKNQYFPVIGWWSNVAGSPDIENDFVQFNGYYGLPTGQTGGGGNPGDPGTPPSNNPITIYQNADFGEENTTEDIVAAMTGANLVISSGDQAYASSPSQFLSIITPLASIWVDCIGNHDDTSSKQNAYLNASHYSPRHFYQNTPTIHYYYVIIENVAVIVMSTETSFSSGSTQYDAINSFLTEIKNNPNIDWIIVTQHRPYFGPSSTHSNNEGNIVQTYHPIFDQYKVDIVFTAHNHNFYRTYPVKYNSGSPTSPTVTDNTNGPYTGGVGEIFIGNGTGGHDSGGNLYPQGAKPSFVKYQNDSENGNSKIVLSNNNKTLTYTWTTLDGTVRETFVINK